MGNFDLKRKLDAYNWDDGFEVPMEILADPGCDLALALEVFYLADGYGYLEKPAKATALEAWNGFITTLYQDILQDKFSKTNASFAIPLSKVQRYRLRKKGTPAVFLTDLQSPGSTGESLDRADACI